MPRRARARACPGSPSDSSESPPSTRCGAHSVGHYSRAAAALCHPERRVPRISDGGARSRHRPGQGQVAWLEADRPGDGALGKPARRGLPRLALPCRGARVRACSRLNQPTDINQPTNQSTNLTPQLPKLATPPT
eukprot:scaffold71532_cov63-Phaeocystis_antarctica.AAC.1